MVNNNQTSTTYLLKEGIQSVVMTIRWTVEAQDELTCLLALRERIEARIFRERLRLEEQPGDVCWDGDETDKIQH